MLDGSQAQRFAEEWYAAWNARDLELILSHYAAEVVFTSPFVSALLGREDGTVRGLQELRNYFAPALERYPDLRFEPLSLLVGVDSVVLHYRSVGGRIAAETMQLDEQGRVIRVLAHYDGA
jgi:ketosteroid isomerase-like protein